MLKMSKTKPIFYWLSLILIIVGFLIRTLVFSYRTEFEDDECRLLYAMLNADWRGIWTNIGLAQSAPPLFLLFSRIWGAIWGYGEHAIKFIPYFCSVLSLFVFWKLSDRFFKQNYTKLVALFLFSINLKLITFSSIFKQYSLDVLVGMLCLLLFSNIQLEKFSTKQTIGLGILLIILPLISLPSIFFIGAFFLINYKNYKKVLTLILPFALNMLFYYIYNLSPSQAEMNLQFPHYWDNGLIGVSGNNLIKVFAKMILYIVNPNKYILFHMILFSIGLYTVIKEKNLIGNLMLGVFLLAIVASCLNLYPFVGRVELYFAPILILLCIKPLETFKAKTALFYIMLILIIGSNYKYNINYFKLFFDSLNFITYSPKELLLELNKNYKDGDIIICNNASESSFEFYSSKMGLKFDNTYAIASLKTEEEAFQYLNGLEKGRRYWFFLVKEFPQENSSVFISEWSKNKKLILKYQNRHSKLFLIEN
jgi:hypothetical protein